MLSALAVGVLALAAWRARPPRPEVIHAEVAQPAPPTPSSVVDPLLPGRPAPLDSAAPALDPGWVNAPPRSALQYSLPASERDGVEPCAAPAPKDADVVQPLSRGYLFTGGQPSLAADGKFDLIVHLHGEGPVRRELLASRQPFVLYTLTLPPSASYAPLFAGSGLLHQLIDEITAATSEHYGREARVGHLALSAWSAGFEGVRSILYQPEARDVEALILLDGLHAPRSQNGLAANLEPFIRFARRAERSERWFAITHSSIPTANFTSSTESAHFLIHELGGKPTAVRRDDGFGLELVDFFSSGNLNVRGYAGNDKADHCAQLFLMRSLLVPLHSYFHG